MTTTSAGALRSAAAIFVLGLLVVWLVRPIGNPCPELGLLPAGSTSSSAPSFAPPLTRTCTYRTSDGTAVRKRYLPVVDALALVLLAGVAGAAVSLAGRGRGGHDRPARAPRRERTAPQRAPRAGARAPRRQSGFGGARREPAPPAQGSPPGSRAGGESAVGDRDDAERERARRERDARRRARGG